MKFPVSFLLLLSTAQAFRPSALGAKRSPVSTARTPLIHTLKNQNDDYLAGADEIYDYEPTVIQEGVDVGEEIFFSNLSEIAEQSVQIERTREESSFVSVDDITSEALAQTSPIGVTAELANVNAVLAASEEAVKAVEASFQPELDLPISDMTMEPIPESIIEIVEEIKRPKIEAPSVLKILKFAIPAMGVWLCGPLLSLIDTSTVGILSGTVQQAALNPAVAVTDYGALLISFLFTGTTNMVASAQESDRAVEGTPRTTKTLIGAMQFSTFIGAGLGLVLFVFARTLLSAMVGHGDVGPDVFDAAMKYVRIRALGMPAAAVIGSTQAACLGMQDIKSPLYVLVAAAVVNFMGDMLFVGNKNPWIGGAAGAAWATVFSQYAAVALFMRWLCKKPKMMGKARFVNLSEPILELSSPTSAGEERRQRVRDAVKDFGRKATRPFDKVASFFKSDSDSFSVRGFLQNRFKTRDLVKFPPRSTIEEFKPYILPVTTTVVGRVSGYVAMSHVVSSSLGTISMAAQQVIVSLFYCLCPLADSLSLTSQSFMPTIFGKPKGKERAAAMRKLAINFGKASAAFGMLLVAAGATIPLVSYLFTTDPVVVSLVNKVVPFLMGIFAVHGFVCAGEGMLLGQKDLAFLGRMYAGFFAVVPFFMLRVKKAALTGSKAVDLTSVWKVFLSYQLFRATSWVLRVIVLQRRTEKEANEM